MDITYNAQEKRFFAVEDGYEYNLEYNEVEKNVWQFNCSFLSRIITNIKELNIRERIIAFAIDFMEKNNIKLMDSGTCFDVTDYVKKQNNIRFLMDYVIKT